MKMALTLPLSLIFSLFLYTSAAFDITQILNQYPEFNTFNSYLTQTNLAADINSRQTITILAVDNANAAALSGKPLDQIKNILSVHVILDYYDVPRLETLSGRSALVTTLFQSSGLARGQQGFLNVTLMGPGSVAFGSAMPGSQLSSNLVKSVVSQPYNFSVVQISSAIIPQGIDGTKISSPPSMAPPATTVTTPPPPSTVVSATSPPTSAVSTPPPPSTVSSATPPAISAVSTPPPTSTAASAATPPTPLASSAAIPSMAPPTTVSASVPSTAPPPLQTAASPQASGAALPSTASPRASMVSASAPTTAAGPGLAGTPSSSPASTPMAAGAPGPALGPGAETPVTEEPVGTTPAAEKGKAKNGGTTLNVGIGGVLTMVLSTLYLVASRI